MNKYKDIVQDVLKNGSLKSPNRSGQSLGVRTVFLPHVLFKHNMADGFPLLTTKKVPWLGVRVELEGFIKGITSKSWFQERGCHFWDHWHSSSSNNEDDLGPLGYSWQWRRFGQLYNTTKDICRDLEGCNGVMYGYDQLRKIVHTLKINPLDRRMVCSAWNPLQLSEMALPPCHMIWGVNADEDRNLHLWMTMRSTDVGIGLPCNIASYGLLLHLLCHYYNFTPGYLSIFMADCHIYENHIDALVEQCEREPFGLPSIEITGGKNEIFDWTHKDVKLIDYHCHPSIKLDVTV